MTITQGEFAASDHPDCVISTILGSCVSTCLWDPDRRVGGMNHVLVARSESGPTRSDAAGVNAMELLINALVRLGGDRRNLRAKVFGGAKMISGLSDIGHLNGLFMLEFLESEGIPCLGQSLGGTSARQIRFFPAEGRALLKSVTQAAVAPVPTKPAETDAGNGVELF
ncbi:chemotaxis protein CheD [Pseudooceanicola sp. LIPI14-2-Ac024]|uniref:chemotaxis protein CheD n=1 Tax=Pseudooceanicola sp. LIPI14-2-Ac024 TaxID=3344875 RepID=UPI0035D04607